MGWMEENKKSALPKKLRLQLAGLNRVRRQVGELLFWVFCAPILWRRWVSTDFSVTIQLCNNIIKI